jgi:hypothetical protein
VLPLTGRDLSAEVKARARAFREIYAWLDGRDVLIVKADRQEPLVIARLSLAAEIQAGWVIMPRRPAQITQAEATRMMRTAKRASESGKVAE